MDARRGPARWGKLKTRRQRVSAAGRGRSLSTSALPGWVPPQLSQLVKQRPEGDGWVHEIEYDGYRMHARLDRGAVQLLTRTGLDWTAKYPATAAALARLPIQTAYLDGELCGVRSDGVTSFSLIQNASTRGESSARRELVEARLVAQGRPED